MKAAWLQAALIPFAPQLFSRVKIAAALSVFSLVLLPFHTWSQESELIFADFDSQAPFNNFSGDNGAFFSKGASVESAFDNRVFRRRGGASLRIDYAVPSGFCGVWHSLLGRASYPRYTLNFTNLYGPLRNSALNPSRVENVRVTGFSFWARGEGTNEFDHQIKVELKNTRQVAGSAVFTVPNRTNWFRCDLPVSVLGTNDVSQMKEVVFVIEDWRNEHRVGCLYLDDLSFTTTETAYNPARWGNDPLLDIVAQRAFLYYLTFTDDLGFALDRSTFSDMVSVGTIGFQLTAYCIGHQRGWSDPGELEGRVAAILQNLRDISMGPEMGTSRGGCRGFYYHFLTANSGTRKDDHVELSLYDTMLLMYGVLSCKQYFADNARIQSLSQEIFDRVEWDWFVDRSPGIHCNRFRLAWQPGPTPEGTFLRHVDGQTDEAFMVDVLAMGSRTHPTSMETYLARNRVYGSYPPGSPQRMLVSWRGSLFNYFFASCWLDFRNRGLDLHPDGPRDLWQNDRAAILANREFCIRHAGSGHDGADGYYGTYGENAWGLTACDNLVAPASGLPGEYFSFGGLPTEENIRFGTKAPHAGTIAVYGAASSINYLPEHSIAALRHYFEIDGLWSPFLGFGDAFSLDPHYLGSPYDTQGNPTIRYADYLNGPWINHMVMGINVGPMLLAIENHRSGLVWKWTSKIPEIATGLDLILGASPAPSVSIVVDARAGRNGINLRWKPQPGISEYCIYTSTDMENWKLQQDGVKGSTWTDHRPVSAGQRFYQVKAIKVSAPALNSDGVQISALPEENRP